MPTDQGGSVSTTPRIDPAQGQLEPKVAAASVGSIIVGAATSLVVWLALRYLGLELTEVQAGLVVTGAAGAGARVFGWAKSSWSSRTSDGFQATGIPKPVTPEEEHDAGPIPLSEDPPTGEVFPGRPRQEDGKDFAPDNRPPRPPRSTPPGGLRRPGRRRGH
jgi:hypothetical protein